MGDKLKAGGLLVVMFVLGAISGSTWQIYRYHHRLNHMFFAERRIARLTKQLHLEPWQEQSLREIVLDAHTRAQDLHDEMDFNMAQIHEDSIDAIDGLLTPEQRLQFEKLHKKNHPAWHEDNMKNAIIPVISTGGATS